MRPLAQAFLLGVSLALVWPITLALVVLVTVLVIAGQS